MIAIRCWNCRAVLCRVPEDLDGFPVPSTLADPEARHLCGRCARDLREPEFDADALLPPAPPAPPDREQLARIANALSRESRRGPGPFLSGASAAVNLVAWLAWNDPNGEYELLLEDGVAPWELVAEVLAEDVEADDALAATQRSEALALAKEGPLSSLARAGVLAAWEAARGGSREGAAELLRACEAYRAAAAMEARWDAVAVGRAS